MKPSTRGTIVILTAYWAGLAYPSHDRNMPMWLQWTLVICLWLAAIHHCHKLERLADKPPGTLNLTINAQRLVQHSAPPRETPP